MKPINRFAVLSVVSALASLLTACGGGGGSGGGGGGGGGGGTTYTVSGTITGLTASGLQLQNNGGGTQSIASGATSFQFTGLSSGGAYAVTVQTQPSGETCGITNGGGTISSANVSNVTVSCSNVVAVSVNPGPASSGNQTFNDLLTSIIVCPSSSRNGCVTINDVLVDTGSEGLRLMKSVLTGAGLSLTAITDPNNAANTMEECLPFADGYTWGSVAMAGVQIGGESAATISVQVIDDSASPSPAAPASCTSNGMSLNSVNAFDANAILGVGQFVQDCGSACAPGAGTTPNIYYSCTGGGSCTATLLEQTDQVANPVASFATDNNGVAINLQSVPDTGAATAPGTLTFGISTQSNNTLGAAVAILTTNSQGYFQTTQPGQAGSSSGFIDSGSNALFFPTPNPAIPTCADATAFYCPPPSSSLSLVSLSATNQGGNGTMSDVNFQVANLDYLAANDGSNYALPNVGGPATAFNNNGNGQVTNYFDWGLPFFYNRTVYVAIDGKSAGGTTGPYFAY